jgi:hypothetical protein
MSCCDDCSTEEPCGSCEMRAVHEQARVLEIDALQSATRAVLQQATAVANLKRITKSLQGEKPDDEEDAVFVQHLKAKLDLLQGEREELVAKLCARCPDNELCSADGTMPIHRQFEEQGESANEEEPSLDEAHEASHTRRPAHLACHVCGGDHGGRHHKDAVAGKSISAKSFTIVRKPHTYTSNLVRVYGEEVLPASTKSLAAPTSRQQMAERLCAVGYVAACEDLRL